MAQFSVNAQRFDPYKNFKFRVKWDGRYVAGVSKVSALKRTTEVVEAPRGRRPEHQPQSRRAAPSTRRSRSSAASPTTPSSRSGPTRSGTSAPGLAPRSRSRTSARTSSSRSTTRPASSPSPTRSTAAGSRSTRPAGPRRQRQRRRDPDIKLENEGWELTAMPEPDSGVARCGRSAGTADARCIQTDDPELRERAAALLTGEASRTTWS